MMVLSLPAMATVAGFQSRESDLGPRKVVEHDTVATERLGQTTGNNGSFNITGFETNSPVAGEMLHATVAVENTGNATANETVELLVNGSRVDQTGVSVGGGETSTVTLEWNTKIHNAGTHTLTVQTADDSVSTTVNLSRDGSTVLHGDITDNQTGDPVQGSHVHIIKHNETTGENVTVAKTRGDAFGSYLTELSPSEYNVVAWAPGYEANVTTVNVTGDSERHDVALDPAPGESIPLYELSGATRDVQTRMAVSATVQVTLLSTPISEGLIESYIASNTDAIARIPGGTATDIKTYLNTINTLFNGNQVQVNTRGQPLGQGSFIFGGLPQGTYQVKVPGSPTHRGNQTQVTLGDTSKQVEFLLYARQSAVNGTVELDLPDGMDEDTVPADNRTRLHIERVGTDGVTWSRDLSTDGNGEFSVDSMPPATGLDPLDPFPGTYKLHVARPGYENATVNFTVPPDTNVTLGDITLAINGTELEIEMRGTQYRVDQDGDNPENFMPIEGAEISLDGTSITSTYVEDLNQTTDADGTVRFTGIPPGDYSYTVEPVTVQGAEVEIDYPRATGAATAAPRNESAADPPPYYPTHHRFGFVDEDGYRTVYHPRPDPVPGRLGGHFITYGDPFYRYVASGMQFWRANQDSRNLSELAEKNFTKDDVLADEELDLTVSTVVNGTEYEATGSQQYTTDYRGVLENSTVLPGTIAFEATGDPRFVEPVELEDPLSSNETVTPNPPIEPSSDYVYGVVHGTTEGVLDRHIHSENLTEITEESDSPPNEPGLLRFNYLEQFDTFGPLSEVNVTLVNQTSGETYHNVSDSMYGDADIRAGHFDVGWVPEGTYEVVVDTSDHPFGALDDGLLGTIEVEGGENRALGLRTPLEAGLVDWTDVTCTTESNNYDDAPGFIDRETTPFAVLELSTGTPDNPADPVEVPLPGDRTWSLYAGDPARDEDNVQLPYKWDSQGTWTGGTQDVSYDSPCDTHLTGDDQNGTLEGWAFRAESWEPLERANINASPGGTDVTGSDGYYNLDIRGDEEAYALTLDHPHRFNEINYESFYGTDFGIKPGVNAHDAYVQKDAASIEGRVTILQDGTEMPAANVPLKFHSEDFELRDGELLKTDEDGTFQISVSPAENATFTIQLLGESDPEADGEDVRAYYPLNVTISSVSLDVGDSYNISTNTNIVTEAVPAKPVVEELQWHHLTEDQSGEWSTTPFQQPTHFLSNVTDDDADGQWVFLELAEFTPAGEDVSAPTLDGPGEVEPAYGPGVEDHIEYIESYYPIESGRLTIDRVADGEVTPVENRTLVGPGGTEPPDWLASDDTGFWFDVSEYEPMYDANATQVGDYRFRVRLSSPHAPKSVETAPEAGTTTFSEENIHVNQPSWAFQLVDQARHMGYETQQVKMPGRDTRRILQVDGGPNDGVHPAPDADQLVTATVDEDGLWYHAHLEANVTKGIGTKASWAGGEFSLGHASPVNVTQFVNPAGEVVTVSDLWENPATRSPMSKEMFTDVWQAFIPIPIVTTSSSRGLVGEWDPGTSAPDYEYKLAPHRDGELGPIDGLASILKHTEYEVDISDPIIEVLEAILAAAGVTLSVVTAGLSTAATVAAYAALEVLKAITEINLLWDTEHNYNWDYAMERAFGPDDEGWPYERLEPAEGPAFDGDSVTWRDTLRVGGNVGAFGRTVDEIGLNITTLSEWDTEDGEIQVDGCEMRYALDKSRAHFAKSPDAAGVQDLTLPPDGVALSSCELGTSGKIHVTPYNYSLALEPWTGHPRYGDINWTAGSTNGTLVAGTDPADTPAVQAVDGAAGLLTHAHDRDDEAGSSQGFVSAWNGTEREFDTDPLAEDLSVLETAMPPQATGDPMVLFTYRADDGTRLAHTTPDGDSWTPISAPDRVAQFPAAVQGPDGDVHVTWRESLTGSYKESIAPLRYARWNGTAFTDPVTVYEGQFTTHDLAYDDGPVALVNDRAGGTTIRQFSGPNLSNETVVAEPNLSVSHLGVAAADDGLHYAWGGTFGGERARLVVDGESFRVANGTLTALDIVSAGNESVLAWAENNRTYTATYNGTWSEPTPLVFTATRTTGLALTPLPAANSTAGSMSALASAAEDRRFLTAYTTRSTGRATAVNFRSGTLSAATFELTGVETNAPLVEGTELSMTVTVENVGEAQGNQTVEAHTPALGNATAAVDLSANESADVTLALDTPIGPEAVGEHVVTVETASDSIETTVAVQLPTLENADGPPGDPDGDDLYENVDGDDAFDIFDVQTFFDQFNDDVIQDHAWAFDFDDDGEIDIFDVQAMFEDL